MPKKKKGSGRKFLGAKKAAPKRRRRDDLQETLDRKKDAAGLSLLTSNSFHPRNPRVITPAQLEGLDEALREFGDLGGLVLNRRTGHLAGGNQRVTTFLEAELPVVITERLDEPDRTGTVAYGYVEMHGTRFSYREVEWDEKKELAANIAANKHGGEWDNEELVAILQELQETSTPENVRLTGYEPGEIERLLRQIQVPDAPRRIDEGQIGESAKIECPECGHKWLKS